MEELFLTAAQSLLALVILANLKFGSWEALVLVSLFVLQFVFPTERIRLLLGYGYLGITLAYLTNRTCRQSLATLVRARGP